MYTRNPVTSPMKFRGVSAGFACVRGKPRGVCEGVRKGWDCQRELQRLGQEGPGFVLHGSVECVLPWREGAAVAHRAGMQPK